MRVRCYILVSKSAICLLAAALMSGCQSIGDSGELTSDSLLQAAETSPDAVTLDIYWARTTLDDSEFAEALWQTVQEDRISADTRYALAREGLRVGVVGGTPSEQIVQLLNPDSVDLASIDDSLAPVTAAPAKVTRRLRQLRPGSRLPIQASDAPQEFTLLRSKNGGLVGSSYPDAQGMYAVQLIGRDTNRVTLELAPELQHGEAHMKYTSSGPGMMVQQLSRDIELFDGLRTEVTLAPGEILVVTCLPDSERQLGGLFHRAESETGPQQKYMLIRLSQVPETPSLTASSESAWPWQ